MVELLGTAHVAYAVTQIYICMTFRGILGWLHHVEHVPLQQLSFKSAIPSKKREGVALAFEYMQWLSQERNISTSTEGIVIRSLMQVSHLNLGKWHD